MINTDPGRFDNWWETLGYRIETLVLDVFCWWLDVTGVSKKWDGLDDPRA